MEFLSPKTKERISKLEAENAELKEVISKGKKTSFLNPFYLLVTTLVAIGIYQFVQRNDGKTSETQEDNIGSIDRVDTIHSWPSSDTMTYSIQIGAFKNEVLKELQKNTLDHSMISKDSLVVMVFGEYRSRHDAEIALGIVINLGVENAFIVAQKNGKAVGLLTEQNRE